MVPNEVSIFTYPCVPFNSPSLSPFPHPTQSIYYSIRRFSFKPCLHIFIVTHTPEHVHFLPSLFVGSFPSLPSFCSGSNVPHIFLVIYRIPHSSDNSDLLIPILWLFSPSESPHVDLYLSC